MLLTDPASADDNSQWTQQRDFPRWMVPGDWSAMSAPLGRALQDLVVGGIGVGIILWLGCSMSPCWPGSRSSSSAEQPCAWARAWSVPS